MEIELGGLTMTPKTTDPEEQASTHRYLVQFREEDQDHFETDFGFRDGHLGLARYHVHLVLDTSEYVVQGRVWDTESGRCVYRYPRPSDSEEQILAIFGEPEELEDVNGSGGIDDDPFVQYNGPDDPELRYS
jgi:hypothetical protein